MKQAPECFVYILFCSDNTYYIGVTNDMTRRLKQHNGFIKGGAKYTKQRRPVSVIYTEQFSTRSLALSREHQLKKLTHDKKTYLILS